MSDTPRTDAVVAPYIGNLDNESIWGEADRLLDHSRKIERELNEANAKLQRLRRLIDLAQKNDDSQSDNELACSATFNEAIALTNSDMVEAERDNWKQVASELVSCLNVWHNTRNYRPENDLRALAHFNKLK